MPPLAWLTAKGEVCGFNFQHRVIVFRSTQGGMREPRACPAAPRPGAPGHRGGGGARVRSRPAGRGRGPPARARPVDAGHRGVRARGGAGWCGSPPRAAWTAPAPRACPSPWRTVCCCPRPCAPPSASASCPRRAAPCGCARARRGCSRSSASRRVEVSAWLDVSGWEVVEVAGWEPRPRPCPCPSPWSLPRASASGWRPPPPRPRRCGRAWKDGPWPRCPRRPPRRDCSSGCAPGGRGGRSGRGARPWRREENRRGGSGSGACSRAWRPRPERARERAPPRVPRCPGQRPLGGRASCPG